MEIISQIALFILGMVLIIYGGDAFVDAALCIGRKIGISTFVLGATVVSLTTTLPELFVSTIASAGGHTELAIGNAVGSIICNTGLILGLCAVLTPMVLNGPSQVKKALLSIGCLLALAALTLSGSITWVGGLGLYLLLAVYLWLNFREMKQAPARTENTEESFSAKHIALFIVGAGSIILGSNILVDSASALATLMHIPEKFIALSVVALGTSLPELVTSLTAIRKKEAGLSIGNIIGANILNIVLVMATSAIVAPGGLTTTVVKSGILQGMDQLLVLDIPVAAVLAGILLFCARKKSVPRMAGIVLLAVYAGYLGFTGYAIL